MLINRVNAQESAGLGLAEAAGLTQDGGEAQFNFLQSFWDYFQADMISSIPITFASILVFAVMIERAFFYNRNSCDIAFLLNNLQSQKRLLLHSHLDQVHRSYLENKLCLLLKD